MPSKQRPELPILARLVEEFEKVREKVEPVYPFDAKTGTVSLRNIAVRASDATVVQVASGLNPGDVVVTAGVQALRPGQKVRLLETQS